MPDENDTVKFLIEEYRNITSAFLKLQDVQIRLFNFFLLITATPIAIAPLVFQDSFDLLNCHSTYAVLLFTVGILDFLMALSIAGARIEQYRYAKVVNKIRAYFLDRDSELCPYLLLPATDEYPNYEHLGFVNWQIRAIILIGGILIGFSVLRIACWVIDILCCRGPCGYLCSGLVAVVILVGYFLAYKLFKTLIIRQRRKRDNDEGKVCERLGE